MSEKDYFEVCEDLMALAAVEGTGNKFLCQSCASLLDGVKEIKKVDP